MAWDFETEPEFEEQLVWMRDFVREEIMPIETFDLSHDQAMDVHQALARRGPRTWTLGRALAVANSAAWASVRSDSGSCTRSSASRPTGPVVFGNNAPDSGNAELLAAGMEMTGPASTSANAGSSRCSTADALGLLDDRARDGRQRPATAQDARHAKTATSGSSTATSGTPRTVRSPTSWS